MTTFSRCLQEDVYRSSQRVAAKCQHPGVSCNSQQGRKRHAETDTRPNISGSLRTPHPHPPLPDTHTPPPPPTGAGDPATIRPIRWFSLPVCPCSTFPARNNVFSLFFFVLSGFRQWWRVTLETGQGTCATWTTQMATDGASRAYITLTKTGMPRYVRERRCVFTHLPRSFEGGGGG